MKQLSLARQPSLVAFVDERVERRAGFTRIIAGCLVFGADRWMARHQYAASVGAVRLRRRLAALDAFVNRIGGIAVVVYADIPSELFPTGETDGTDDIPRMSRADNLWSQVILSGVTAALAWLQRSGVPIGLVDLYFDRKDLTSGHRAQFDKMFRQTLSEISRGAAMDFPELFGTASCELRFGAIAGIDKPGRGASFDTFQRGTNVAHHLCSQARRIIKRGPSGRTLVRDHTGVVRDMVVKFLGSSDENAETLRTQPKLL